MGRVEDKIVAITGAARGQGRSHAVRLAEEGADIIAVDVCADLDVTDYPLGTTDELAETARLVEKAGRRVVVREVDVRDRKALAEALASGVNELGRLDAVVANAGILPMGPGRGINAFVDTVDTNLLGAINTVHAALPHLGPGGSVIVTGSAAGLMPGHGDVGSAGSGFAAYKYAKRTLVDFVNTLAVQLGPTGRRINAIHPTNVDTEMLHNEPMYRALRPDLDEPTRSDVEQGVIGMHALAVPHVPVGDVSHAVVYLTSDESRYVTGMHLKIDAGSLVKSGL
ncbi:mycofactocin-coupled SDR family oxidoreductase [Actinoplanes sp. NPDC051343]|jgi:SDR family mycofactocin-dependent oxidoreductase|uniref:mycofactocin-coupled SDR family oxidoreductase n=1 Tax=Actinoplanes sp. NPDC051343 TaxID=3363906 RepID=UPI0037ACFAA3